MGGLEETTEVILALTRHADASRGYLLTAFYISPYAHITGSTGYSSLNAENPTGLVEKITQKIGVKVAFNRDISHLKKEYLVIEHIPHVLYQKVLQHHLDIR